MVVKILFYGSHSTGKTLLLDAIERKFKLNNPPIVFGTVAEQSRALVRTGALYQISRKDLIDEGTTAESQLSILYSHMAEEMKLYSVFALLEKKDGIPRVILCDRGPDNLAYYERNVGPYAPELESFIKNHMKTFPYTIAIRVPITSEELINDGERDSENKKYQLEIETMIDYLMDDKWRDCLEETQILKLEKPKNEERTDWTQDVLIALKTFIPQLNIETGSLQKWIPEES